MCELLEIGQISIHALREEGDSSARAGGGNFSVISIHALREEGDKLRMTVSVEQDDFYPRPPRGGRPLFRYPL